MQSAGQRTGKTAADFLSGENEAGNEIIFCQGEFRFSGTNPSWLPVVGLSFS